MAAGKLAVSIIGEGDGVGPSMSPQQGPRLKPGWASPHHDVCRPVHAHPSRRAEARNVLADTIAEPCFYVKLKLGASEVGRACTVLPGAFHLHACPCAVVVVGRGVATLGATPCSVPSYWPFAPLPTC